jgi:hypothetical protein
MPTRVQLPDGTIGEFPDGMSEQDIEGVLKKQYPTQVSPKAEAPNSVIGGLLRRGADTARGIGGLVAPPNTTAEKAASFISPGAVPIMRAISGMADSIPKGLHQAGQYLHEANTVPSGNPLLKTLGYARAGTTALGALNPLTSGSTENINRLADTGRLKEATGQGLTDAALLGAPAIAGKVGQALKAGGATLDRAIIGAPANSEFGANPGAALSENRIVGSTPGTLVSKIKDVLPGATAEHRGILQRLQGNTLLDRSGAITRPFSENIAAGTDPVTGAASRPQIGAALRAQHELTHEIDPATGRVVTHPVTGDPIIRPASISPLDAARLKSSLYDRIDYDNPSNSSIANSSLKGAAHNLKSSIEQAIPESIPAGQKLHDLMSAKDILEPTARAQKFNLGKSGIIDRASMLAGTGGAAGADIAGSAISSPSIRALLRAAPLVPKREDEQ